MLVGKGAVRREGEALGGDFWGRERLRGMICCGEEWRGWGVGFFGFWDALGCFGLLCFALLWMILVWHVGDFGAGVMGVWGVGIGEGVGEPQVLRLGMGGWDGACACGEGDVWLGRREYQSRTVGLDLGLLLLRM